MTFDSLEKGLIFDDFSKLPWDSPRTPQTLRLSLRVANCFKPRLRNKGPSILETDSRSPEREPGGLGTELGVYRIHDTQETELQMMPRSLVAPHNEGLAD